MAGSKGNGLGMKIVSAGMAVVGVWYLVSAVIGLINPNGAAARLQSTGLTFQMNGVTTDLTGLVYVMLGLQVVIALLILWFAYAGFTLKPKKGMGVLCLIVGIIALIEFITGLTHGAAVVDDVRHILGFAIPLAYWWFARQFYNTAA